MDISEVHVKLTNDPRGKLRAFCSMTVDDSLAVRDMKIVEMPNGLFVAMPSRRLTRRCTKCGTKNHLRAKYCSECGAPLRPLPLPQSPEGRLRLHADIVFPTNAAVRQQLHRAVIQAYDQEVQRAGQPGYVPPNGVADDETPGPWPDNRPRKPSPPPSRDEEGPETDSFGAGIL